MELLKVIGQFIAKHIPLDLLSVRISLDYCCIEELLSSQAVSFTMMI